MQINRESEHTLKITSDDETLLANILTAVLKHLDQDPTGSHLPTFALNGVVYPPEHMLALLQASENLTLEGVLPQIDGIRATNLLEIMNRMAYSELTTQGKGSVGKSRTFEFLEEWIQTYSLDVITPELIEIIRSSPNWQQFWLNFIDYFENSPLKHSATYNQLLKAMGPAAHPHTLRTTQDHLRAQLEGDGHIAAQHSDVLTYRTNPLFRQPRLLKILTELTAPSADHNVISIPRDMVDIILNSNDPTEIATQLITVLMKHEYPLMRELVALHVARQNRKTRLTFLKSAITEALQEMPDQNDME